ncbi:OmpA family protein [Zavarzinia compransoris]|uniref:OmpA family protein n=1 Tax=Zavarzinia marina TaxID=2911065 RepID=UPI001F2A37CE|nr:OmpA family protein [Zavarzinia marina]MCF4166802.1 OmpA family protein [Zavarzinia marina]
MRAATSARAFHCAARTGAFSASVSPRGVSLKAIAVAVGLMGLGIAPAHAGGNEEDQSTHITVPARPHAGGAGTGGRPAPARRYDPAIDFQTIVIGGGSAPGVIVDMSVLDDLMAPPPPPRPRAVARPAPRLTPPPAPAAAAPPAPVEPEIALVEPEAPAETADTVRPVEKPDPSAPAVALPEPVEPESVAPEPSVAEPVAPEPEPAPPPVTIDVDTPRTLAMIELGSRLGEPAMAEPPPPPAPEPAPPPPPPPAPASSGPTDLTAGLPEPEPEPAPPEPLPEPEPVPEPAPAAAPATSPAPAPTTAAAAVPAPAVAGRGGLPSVAKQVTQVAFATSGDALDDDGRAALDAVVEQLKEPGGRILVRGFASGTNDTATGARRLSRQRVLAVRTYLIEKGVPATLIDLRAVGMAPDAPVADGVDIAIMP